VESTAYEGEKMKEGALT